MDKRIRTRLVEAALSARKNACAPYSRFRVGAAVLADSGQVFAGANIESASYGLTCCAERVALFHALSEGVRRFRAIAVAGRTAGGPMPCGACRQLLMEYAPAAMVLVVDSLKPAHVREFPVGDLLPAAFTLDRSGGRPSDPR